MVEEMERTGEERLFLDLTHRGGDFIRERFPRIYETCLRYGVDLGRQPAPVHPAAHYAMGGVRTDLDGRTNLRRLWAAGEVACTGVHGANRLASNSLLEGLVYGARAGLAMGEWGGRAAPKAGTPPAVLFPDIGQAELRRLTWLRCGIVRSGEGLSEACTRLIGLPVRPCPGAGRGQFEVRNMHCVALSIARCALARTESRGAHRRSDYPGRHAQPMHSVIQRDGSEVVFE
jgi:L-aspartate oxidase